MSRTHVRTVTARPSAPVRLTRRGRLVVVVVVALASFASLLLGRALADEPAAPARTVVVRPGETLWEITSRLRPGEDPRPTITQIVEVNDLPDAGVAAGQRLRIPAGG